MSKQKVVAIQKKIDALELELTKINVNDPKVAQHIADVKAELVTLHASQDTE